MKRRRWKINMKRSWPKCPITSIRSWTNSKSNLNKNSLRLTKYCRQKRGLMHRQLTLSSKLRNSLKPSHQNSSQRKAATKQQRKSSIRKTIRSSIWRRGLKNWMKRIKRQCNGWKNRKNLSTKKKRSSKSYCNRDKRSWRKHVTNQSTWCCS